MRIGKYHEKVLRRKEYDEEDYIDLDHTPGGRGAAGGRDPYGEGSYDQGDAYADYNEEPYPQEEASGYDSYEGGYEQEGSAGRRKRSGRERANRPVGKRSGKKSGNKKKRTAGDMVLTGILVIAIGVFLYAAFNLLHIYTEYKKGSDEYNAIAKMAVTEKEAEKLSQSSTSLTADILQSPMSIDFAALKEVNEDVIAWIYIEALDGVSYPVVRGIDNNYYLHLTYQKNYNYAGTIFVDKDCNEDFNDCHTLIYGHNMQDGSMFGRLKKFSSSMEAYEKSKYFWIFTPEYDYRYEIISAYTTAVDSFTYTLFKGPGEEFIQYLTKVVEASEIPTDTENLSVNDKIITLSTCTGNEATRYVVQGKRVDAIRKTIMVQ